MAGNLESGEDGGPQRPGIGGRSKAHGSPRASRSPRLRQIRVLQKAVRHVALRAVQVPALLAEKDLAARAAPAAQPPPPRLQHARLLRGDPLPAGGGRGAQGTAPPAPARGPGASTSRPRRAARPHLLSGGARPPSSAKGLNQPQKPLSARRSSATCRMLDSWLSG